jgi:transcriptional regulator with XRE-family HTH domain
MKRDYPAVDMIKTGQNIKRIMHARGYTVRDVQAFLQLGSPQGIYHWFEGKSMPSLDNIYALSELFRVPVDAIIRGNRKYVFVPLCDEKCSRLYFYYEKMAQLRAG